MKSKSLLLISLIITICLSFCFCLPAKYCYADELTPENYGQPGDTTDEEIDENFVKKYAGKVSSFFYVIAVLVAVISFSALGIKYITGGITQKADYKKDIIPMVIGVMFIALLGAILQVIANVAASI